MTGVMINFKKTVYLQKFVLIVFYIQIHINKKSDLYKIHKNSFSNSIKKNTSD